MRVIGIFTNCTQAAGCARLFRRSGRLYGTSAKEAYIRRRSRASPDPSFRILYLIAANYDYAALAGTYVLNRDAEGCTLDPRSDRTFAEELVRTGKVQEAKRTWHRYGESTFRSQVSSLQPLVKR